MTFCSFASPPAEVPMNARSAAGFFRTYLLGGARPDWENYVHFRGDIQRHLPQKVRLSRVARHNTAEEGAMSRNLAEGVLVVRARRPLTDRTAGPDQPRAAFANPLPPGAPTVFAGTDGCVLPQESLIRG